MVDTRGCGGTGTSCLGLLLVLPLLLLVQLLGLVLVQLLGLVLGLQLGLSLLSLLVHLLLL